MIPMDSDTITLSYTGDNPDINYIDTRSGLYTNSELPAVSPPAMLDIVRLPSRTVAISAENPFEILSTKPGSFGRLDEWNPVCPPFCRLQSSSSDLLHG